MGSEWHVMRMNAARKRNAAQRHERKATQFWAEAARLEAEAARFKAEGDAEPVETPLERPRRAS